MFEDDSKKPLRAFVGTASVALILSNGSLASLAFAGRKWLFARHSCAYGVYLVNLFLVSGHS
ncbi:MULTISPECIES: hypothetical protein [Brucella]|uniref:Uncharacterized protein n=9 Tax=Brucella TaxID=234 RepID=A0AAI8E9G8_BRUSS|nr:MULTISPECIES: hypothetical protein [Brucella]ERM86058.1 hypothetical protein P865_10490 [Brucella abortus 82]EXU82992.1 hypothetical protein AX23_09155 [Brucella melitensis 548]KEY00443.1 hypothetical protein IL60_0208275 [Brucella inopinata BO1]ACO00679.1 Hypothetical protein, conserved [Brucella melitensis ATCC 23457]ACU47874.1 hypothetical protein BMI_I885 [Brucella microti CCM 4915]